MKRKVLWLMAAVSLTVAIGYAANPPAVQWIKTFPKGTRTQGAWVGQTGDGGYVVAGTWRPNNESFDFYLVKTDSLGNLQWDKTLGIGPVAWVYSGGLTDDGGYLLVGQKQDSRHSWGLLVKTDSLGNIQWSKDFEPERQSEHSELALSSVQQTRDRGYIVGGYGGGGDLLAAYLIKTDSIGNVEWRRVFSWGYKYGYYVRVLPVHQTSDGGYIIGTIRDSVLRLIKTDTAGNMQWERVFPGKGVGGGDAVQQTQDGGYIATGIGRSSNPESNRADVYLLKTDASGNFQWKKTYGGPDLDNGRWVTQTSDGGYLVAGITNGTGAEYSGDGYLVRTDSAGNLIWAKVIGEPNQLDMALCAQETSDGGYIVTGWAGFGSEVQGRFYQGHLYLLKLAPEGRRKN